MKLAAITTFLAAAVGSVMSTPAMIWQQGTSSGIHVSESVESTDLFSQTIKAAPESSSLASVVFLVSRHENGSDGLSYLASQGSIPKAQGRAEEAAMYHYVRGVQSPSSVVFDAKHGADSIELISLNQFPEKMENLDEESKDVDVLVVEVPHFKDESVFDEAIISAIENPQVGSVIVTALRSIDEVGIERDFELLQRRKDEPDSSTSRRRLEDANFEEYEEAVDEQGTYYVKVTPNIFSGILFFLFFIFVTQIGVGCLNQISFSDAYVDKYPTIGREH
jgi:hypothetical protein